MACGGVARISSLDESGSSGVQDLEVNLVTIGQGYLSGRPCHSDAIGRSEALESDRPAIKSQLYRLPARGS